MLRQAIRKKADTECTSKLVPRISPFFLSVSRTRWLRHRPAVCLGAVARGGRVTSSAEDYTSSGSFHSPPSPQGEGKERRAQLSLGFPLRGSCRLLRRLMRCSRCSGVPPASKFVPVGRTMLAHNMIGTGSGHCPLSFLTQKRNVLLSKRSVLLPMPTPPSPILPDFAAYPHSLRACRQHNKPAAATE